MFDFLPKDDIFNKSISVVIPISSIINWWKKRKLKQDLDNIKKWRDEEK